VGHSQFDCTGEFANSLAPGASCVVVVRWLNNSGFADTLTIMDSNSNSYNIAIAASEAAIGSKNDFQGPSAVYLEGPAMFAKTVQRTANPSDSGISLATGLSSFVQDLS